ncbi:hypothetical protein [Pararhodobacter aggregans]
MMRKNPDQGRAVELCERVRDLDRELIELVMTYQDDMTLKGTGELVKMQTRLRHLRYLIEGEAHIDLPMRAGPSQANLLRG